jgi:hypothetical protein
MKPCPFCGSLKITALCMPDGDIAYMVCNSCGATGPKYPRLEDRTEAERIAAHNAAHQWDERA